MLQNDYFMSIRVENICVVVIHESWRKQITKTRDVL